MVSNSRQVATLQWSKLAESCNAFLSGMHAYPKSCQAWQGWHAPPVGLFNPRA